ncbi:DoxX family protein [Nocardia sp. NPDC055321]
MAGGDGHAQELRPYVLLLARLVLGVNFVLSGTSALAGWPNASPQATPGEWPYWWAGLFEVVVGVLLILGAYTFFAGLFGAGMMAYAYIFVHAAGNPDRWWDAYGNGGQAASAFGVGLLLIAFFGPGAAALSAGAKRPVRR